MIVIEWLVWFAVVAAVLAAVGGVWALALRLAARLIAREDLNWTPALLAVAVGSVASGGARYLLSGVLAGYTGLAAVLAVAFVAWGIAIAATTGVGFRRSVLISLVMTVLSAALLFAADQGAWAWVTETADTASIAAS